MKKKVSSTNHLRSPSWLHVLILLTLIGTSVSVEGQRVCNTTDYNNIQNASDPNIAHRRQQIENFTQNYVQTANHNQARDIVTIPCVVHVIYNTSAENISDAQIQSQMDVINEDFRRTNADASNTPAAFLGVAADTEIEFCLATIDPQGNATTGITRTQTTRSSWGTNDDMKRSADGGVDPWPTDQYLNMWVCNLSGGILGYAQFPGGPAATDGVVMLTTAFGRTGNVSSPFDLGRTTTHEIGHWLNLYHIWGDGGCGVDDQVSDTPESDAPNYGCATGHTSCSSTDMPQNYMDYSDDNCMNLFTQGQKQRMLALFASGGARESLLSSGGCGGVVTPSCSTPSGLSASNISNNAATLNWNVVSGANSYNIQYKETSAGSWTSVTSNTNSYNVSGLTTCTAYEFQVQSVCDSSSSGFSPSQGFTSGGCPGCTANSYCAITMNSSDEYIDNVTVNGINNTSGDDSGYGDFTGSASTMLNRSATYAVSMTPGYNGTAFDEYFKIFIDYNQDGDFDDSGEEVFDAGSTSQTTVNGNITIPAGATLGSTRMRVVMEYDNAPTACESSNDFGETEDYCVTIGEAGPTCDAPTGISTSGVGDNSATVSWSAATGATSYNIQYKPTSSGVWSSTTSNTTSIALSGLANCTEHEVQIQTVCASGTSSFSSSTTFTTTGCAPSCGTPTSLSASNLTPNSADITWFDVAGATNYNVRYKESAAGSWTTTTSNSNSMTLTGLNTCTAYDFEVQADCSGTTGSFSNTANFTTTGCSGGSGCVTYCASSGDSVDEWIEDITIGSLTNNSGDDGGYGDHTAGPTATFSTEGVYNVSLIPGFTNTVYEEYWRIWIDYNQDGDFDEGNELAFDAGTASENTVTGSITIPAGATTGNTGLRIQMKYFNSGNRCQNFDFGEVEDYCVTISTGAAPCDVPTGITVGNIGETTATVSWTSVGAATSYNYQYKEVSAGSWTSGSTASTSVNITGLTEGTDYEVQVEAVCPSGVSGYSSSATFTTNSNAGPCGIPQNVAVSGVTDTTALITWDTHPDASKYQVIYRQIKELPWHVKNTTAGQWQATGLQPARIYGAFVKARCNGSWTGWSAPLSFVTTGAGSCDVPTGVTAENITGNSAVMVWNAMSGVDRYIAMYREAGTTTWNSLNQFVNQRGLGGLQALTTYECRVRAMCDDQSITAGSAIHTFTTADASYVCDFPTGVNITGITSNSATINWPPVPAADVYRVVYRVDSVGSPWSVRFAYSESFDMTGLDQGTDYVSRVSARCPQGWTGYSVSAHGRFTTNSSVRDNGFIGEQEIELNVSLRPNPASDFATVEWSGKAGVAEVAVYDILGRKTSSYIQDEVKETGKLRLDLTGFPNGQYLIQVIAADKSIVKKLLVTK